jgi:tellurite resistance protein TerC
MTTHPAIWIGFGVFVLTMLALDLGVFHRKSHVVGFKEALGWTAAWVVLALLFNLGVWAYAGREKALEFFTGYLIEYSLSADNVFVFALIFSYFGVAARWQHKVLFWGIFGALVMRLVMIFLGTALVLHFKWMLYVFGVFLLVTGMKMLLSRDERPGLERNWLVRWLQKVLPVTPEYHEDRFLTRATGRWMATPLLLALACIELSDLLFAVDSIPAIFGVTLDPFIIYTSNVFAILGLRSLYFVLARALHLFHYLKPGLAVVLMFVGAKMLVTHTAWKVGTLPALLVVAGVLTAAIVASILRPRLRGSTAPPRSLVRTERPSIAANQSRW